MTKVSLANPADIVAAAAPLIGFAPTNSVVAYMLHNNPDGQQLLRATIRFDITITVEQAARFPRTCNLTPANYSGAILLAICDPELDYRARVILDALRDALQAAGIPVQRRLLTRDVTNAGTWVDLDSGQRGPTYPYTDSILAAQRAHQAGQVAPSRADIEREFAPAAPAPVVAVGDPAQLIVATTKEIAEVLAGNRIPSPTLATRAGIAISAHPGLRDAILRLALDHEQAAAELWTDIARQLRARQRAEALTVAAACYALTTDTVRAGIALDIAIDEADNANTEPPQLATLLLDALQSGITPDEIRAALTRDDPEQHS